MRTATYLHPEKLRHIGEAIQSLLSYQIATDNLSALFIGICRSCGMPENARLRHNIELTSVLINISIILGGTLLHEDGKLGSVSSADTVGVANVHVLRRTPT